LHRKKREIFLLLLLLAPASSQKKEREKILDGQKQGLDIFRRVQREGRKKRRKKENEFSRVSC